MFSDQIRLTSLTIRVNRTLTFRGNLTNKTTRQRSFRVPNSILTRVISNRRLVTLVGLNGRLNVAIGRTTSLTRVQIRPFKVTLRNIFSINRRPQPTLTSTTSNRAITTNLTRRFRHVLNAPSVTVTRCQGIRIFLRLTSTKPIKVATVMFNNNANVRNCNLTTLLLHSISNFRRNLVIVISTSTSLHNSKSTHQLTCNSRTLW